MSSILSQKLNIKDVVLICTTVFGVGYALAQKMDKIEAKLESKVSKHEATAWSDELKENNPHVKVPSFAKIFTEAK